LSAFLAAVILAMVMSPGEKELVSGGDILRRRFRRARRRRKERSPGQVPECDAPAPDERSPQELPDDSIQTEKPS
jgi:hypothetical protein